MELFDTAITLGGVLLGFILGRRERNLRKPASPYMCDCKHPFSMHNRKGECKYLSGKIGSCDCQQYTGIRPDPRGVTA